MRRICLIAVSVCVLCLICQGTAAFAAPETPVIPYCAHNWGRATYQWSEDLSACTATCVCTKNAAHKLTETVETAVADAEEEPGYLTYTACFKNEAIESASRTVPHVHDWEETRYTWSEDRGACTAVRVCRTLDTHRETETVAALVRITRFAGAEEGELTYDAVFENAAFSRQSFSVSYAADLVLWGDANGDGTVSGKDIVRLKNYLANLDDETALSSVSIFPGADANGDGAVSSKDIVRLKNYFANLDDSGVSTVILGPA